MMVAEIRDNHLPSCNFSRVPFAIAPVNVRINRMTDEGIHLIRALAVSIAFTRTYCNN